MMLISQFAEHTGVPATTLPLGLPYPVPVCHGQPTRRVRSRTPATRSLTERKGIESTLGAVSGPQLLPIAA